jgi:Trk K+ transport system NAD-binding subunit
MPAPRHVVVVGSDSVGFRVAERLALDGFSVTVVALPGSWLAEARAPAAWGLLRARPEAHVLLEEAGLREASAFLAVSEADEVNLGAALVAREARPGIRLVVRQFNTRLAPLLAQHLPDAEILSLSALAAPTFALSVLTPGVLFAHPLGEETLVLREVEPGEPVPPGARVLASEAAEDGGSPLAGRRLVASGARDLPRHAGPTAVQTPATPRLDEEREAGRLLFLTVAALGALLLGESAWFAWRLGLSPLDAVYFSSTILTTVGFGDFSLRETDPLSKVIGIVTMFGGLFLTALLVSLLTSRLVARREAHRRGLFRQGLSDHVVVCGLGTLGLRIAEDLRRRGVDVVAIDPGPRPRLLALARGAGVQVVEGDGTEERALLFAGLPRARALVAATDRDHLNLEIALVARSLSPGLPLTVRLFDGELGRRVRRTFGIQSTLSGAALTAGRFASVEPPRTRLADVAFADRTFELVAVPGPGTVHRLAAAAGGSPLATWGAARGLDFDPRMDADLGADEILVGLRQGG